MSTASEPGPEPAPEPAPERATGVNVAVLGGRLSPAVLVLWPLAQLVPLVFLLVTGALDARIVLALIGVAIASSVVRWRRFTWRLDAGALVVQQGLVQRRRRVIPLERIQSVDLVRKLRHRALGVVEVRVEAVGGSGTEGTLDAVPIGEATKLRALLLRQHGDAQVPGPSGARDAALGPVERGHELTRMSPRRLVLAGVTGGRVGVAAALLGTAEQVFGNRVQELFGRLPGLVGPSGVVGLAVAIGVGAFLLSVVATTVAYWGFTLVRDGEELRVRRGLLEQRLDTLPLRRVQALRVEQNLLRRLFGLASVKVDVAGRAGGDEARESSVLLPLGTLREATQLVADVLDEPDLARALRSMPRAARGRRVRRGLAVAGVLLVVAGAVPRIPGLAVPAVPLVAGALALGVVAVLVGLDAYAGLGWVEARGHLIGRSGVLVRRTAFVPVARLQSLSAQSTPFQRRLGLATLDLQIARSPGAWGGPRLIDVATADVERWLAELTHTLTSPARPPRPGSDHEDAPKTRPLL